MTNVNKLSSLKTIAKRLARQQRVALHVALDRIASAFEFPHWKGLTVQWEKGWRPDPAMLDAFVLAWDIDDADTKSRPPIGVGLGTKEEGNIDGHPYTMEIDFEVAIHGDGWAICVEHAPSEDPVIEVYNDSPDNPGRSREFVLKALAIAEVAAEKLRGRIASDWPRRSTMPDRQGRALHPLRGGLSKEWFCLHCDAVSTGEQIAENMWHCPKCSATPLDIFATPFWKAEKRQHA